jgi:alanine racemase
MHWRRARVSIDLNAISHNLNRVRDFAPNTKIMAVIKADAYGHGMLAVAEQLVDADYFAVATPQEAYALRSAGCKKTIIVLHGFSSIDELNEFSKLNLSSVIHQQTQLDYLQEATLSSPIDAWLKIDTGMHRLGFSTDKVDAIFGQLRNNKNIAEVFLMSHFANAEDVSNSLNNNQLKSFIKVTNDIDVSCSMANSAAIISQAKSHFETVRPGIMLYGSSPFADTSAAELELQAAMQFESIILDIKTVKAGEAIGYGNTYICKRETRLGIVAAGYGDGYPRHAKNGTPVWVNNQQCDLLGRVSMDSLCIDLAVVDANVGDRVVLWGKELSVDLVAQASDTIAYELLCHAGAANVTFAR